MDIQQEDIRIRLNSFIIINGTKAKFIAEQCKVDPGLICRFRKGKKQLWPETLAKIDEFLIEHQ